MQRNGARFGLALCTAYLALYTLSLIYSVGILLFEKPTAEFNPPSLVAIPWSLVLIPYYQSLGIGDLYLHLTRSPVLYSLLMWSVLLPGALVNAGCLYLVGKFLDGLMGRK